MTSCPVTNAVLSELLLDESTRATDWRARALRRASHRALLWPVEASSLADPTVLETVGPSIGRLMSGWIADPPATLEPPEARCGFQTLASARAVLAADPGLLASLHGDLQMHTTYSDGGGTIREMAAAAIERGYGYVAITDHSKGLKIAHGMDEGRLAEQAEEIREVNDELAGSITLLHAIEMNLSPDGEGDMDPDALASLDLVLGAFHSALRATDDQTERYLAAMRNPHIHVLAHPRGRMYDRRPGLHADWPRVFDAAARAGIALEIDSFPNRQDLQISLLEIARDSGVRISIGTDAHAPSQLHFIEFGVAAATAAGIETERILNTLGADDLRAWARR